MCTRGRSGSPAPRASAAGSLRWIDHLICGGNMGSTTQQDRRWWALIVLCLGNLMIVLDTTIVNVALPSIRTDLGFTESSLAWVVNAYLLTFGGCLLLGGRLGDIYGHRKLFLTGLVLFTASSVACGLSTA